MKISVRCPKSAKYAVTSDTNSCVILNGIPADDDDLDTDDLEIDPFEGDIDPDTTMLIDTPQARFKKNIRVRVIGIYFSEKRGKWVKKVITIHAIFDKDGRSDSNICSGFRVSFNQERF